MLNVMPVCDLVRLRLGAPLWVPECRRELPGTMRRMQLRDAPVVDVRPVLTEERADLLGFLAGLTAEEWETPTAAPGWRVKDVALHLLDDDLGWLSRGRDGDRSGRLADTGE